MNELTENRNRPSISKRIFSFPLLQIILGILLVNVPTFILRNIAQGILSAAHVQNQTVNAIVIFAVRIITVYFAYILFVKIFEKRRADEVSLDMSSLKQFSIGGAIGLISIALILGIMWIFRAFTISGIRSSSTILQSLLYHFFFAFLQDVVYFLIIFRVIEKSLGSWTAMVIASLIFGIKHLLFPGYTVWSGIAQALEAGILFSALFIRTRKIWILFGFHFVWNFIEYGLILGFEPEKLIPLFQSEFTGSHLVTGAPVGPEASIISVGLLTGIGIYIASLAHKEGKFILPSWKK